MQIGPPDSVYVLSRVAEASEWPMVVHATESARCQELLMDQEQIGWVVEMLMASRSVVPAELLEQVMADRRCPAVERSRGYVCPLGHLRSGCVGRYGLCHRTGERTAQR